MERRKFLGAIPLAAGGAIALRSADSFAQTQAATTYASVKSYGAVGDGVTDDTRTGSGCVIGSKSVPRSDRPHQRSLDFRTNL